MVRGCSWTTSSKNLQFFPPPPLSLSSDFRYHGLTPVLCKKWHHFGLTGSELFNYFVLFCVAKFGTLIIVLQLLVAALYKQKMTIVKVGCCIISQCNYSFQLLTLCRLADTFKLKASTWKILNSYTSYGVPLQNSFSVNTFNSFSGGSLLTL